MAYPLTFTAFDWEDLPSEGTPVDKEDLQTAEARLAKFTEEFEIHWRHPVKKESELPKVEVIKGDIFLVEETRELVVYNGVEYVKLSSFVPFWKAPVTEASKLPVGGNTVGDVRLVLETEQFYICYNTTGTAPEQWKLFLWLAHSHTTETLTWSVAEALTNEPETIPGGFRRLATEETQTLYEVEFELAKGEAELELKVNGTAVKFEGGSTEVKVKTAPEALPLQTPLVFSSKDKIELIVHAVSEEPSGLAFSAFVEHVAKAV